MRWSTLLSLAAGLTFGSTPALLRAQSSEPALDGSMLGAHAVQIGPEGRLQAAFGGGEPTGDARVVLADLARGFEGYLERGGEPRVLVFIHGGLNSEAATRGRIERFSETIETTGYYPIFVSWDSRLGSSYKEHLLYLRQGQSLRTLPGVLSSPFVFASDVVRALGRAPLVWGTQVLNLNSSLERAFLDVSDWEGAEDDLRREFQRALLEPPREDEGQAEPRRVGHGQTVAYEGRGDERTSGTKTFQAVVRGALLLPQFVSAPFIDAFGKRAWEVLQRRTQLLFHRDRRMQPGGLALVLDEIQRVLAETKRESSDWELALVGHSMGAIVVNQILREYGDLPISDVVYMAAACSVRDYEDSAFPFLRIQRDLEQYPRIYHLTLHEKAEVREGFYRLLVEGSLLVWIDDFLATPLTERDRTAGRFENIAEAVYQNTPSEFRRQVHLKKFGVEDGGPQRHGDFSGAGFWCRERWEPQRDRSLHADLEPLVETPPVGSGPDAPSPSCGAFR